MQECTVIVGDKGTTKQTPKQSVVNGADLSRLDVFLCKVNSIEFGHKENTIQKKVSECEF